MISYSTIDGETIGIRNTVTAPINTVPPAVGFLPKRSYKNPVKSTIGTVTT